MFLRSQTVRYRKSTKRFGWRGALAVLCLCLVPVLHASAKSVSLRIYFIDVEGGQATLIVGPSGQSLLMDAGRPGGRDTDRIVAVAKLAGITQIDYLVVTHYHENHVGGVPELAQSMRVGMFVDHGPDVEDSPTAKGLYAAYQKAISHADHVLAKPGEGLPLKDVSVEFVASAGAHIADPLPGAGEANPYCWSEAEPAVDLTENAQSVGLLVTYGRFRFLDLGDLTEKKELELVCPNNRLGTVDFYLATHHGAAPDNPKSLVWALRPRVAVINNGAKQGGSSAAWQIVHDSPGMEDVWQLHYAADAGKAHNVADQFIANVDEKSDGHFLEVTASMDGKCQVTNSRNGYRKKYGK